MAQPNYAIEYIGAVEAKKNLEVTSTGLLATFPTATVIKMKTAGVRASVNDSVMFLVDYNDESYLVAGNKYMFDKDCVIAVGKYRVVT
jgi:hypothetical protein